MTMKERTSILKTFNIEPNEAAPVFLLIVQSIFLGIFYGTFDIGAHTLFLKAFPEDMIPKAYIVSGFAGIIMTSIFSRYQSKIKFSSLAKYTLLFISLLTILVRIFFEFSTAKWTVFLVFMLLGPLNILAILAFWGTVSRIFSLRQGKRLFGIIDTGQVFGIIISSFAIPLIITHIKGTNNLLIISSLSIIFGMAIEMIIAKKYNLDEDSETKVSEEDTEREQVKLKDFIKNPYILYLALFVVFSMFAAFFVQFSFLVVTNEQYPVEDDLAKFLGFFTGSMMAFTFIIKTFVYSKLIKTYGLKVSLMLSSLLLLVFTGLAIIVGSFGGYELSSKGFVYFFLLITISKLFNKTLKDALEIPSFKILYQSLKKSIRFDVQAKIDGTINEISALISGLLLGGLGLLTFIKIIHFSVFLFVLLAIWAFITMRLYREYRKSLEETLKSSTDEAVMEEKLRLPEEIIANINLSNKKLYQYKYFNPDQYLAYLKNSFENCSFEQLLKLDKMHQMELSLMALSDKTLTNKFWNGIEKPNNIISTNELGKLLDSSDLKTWLNAVKYIVELEEKERTNQLLALLRIPSINVQRIGIRIGGYLHEQDIIGTMAEFIDSELLLPDVLLSLKQMAKIGSKQFIQMFYKTDIEPNAQLALMDIIGAYKSKESEQFFLENISHHKKEIRNKVIFHLKEFDFKSGEKDYPKLFHAITEVAQVISWDTAALAAFGSSQSQSPLFQALHYEYQQHQNILLDLLAITYNQQSVEHVKDHLNSGTAEGAGYALELFDLFLAEEIKPFIIALFEDLPYFEKAKLLENFFPVKVPDIQELITQVLNRDPNLISKTTKKIALYQYTNYYKTITDDLIAQIFNPEKELQALSSQIAMDLNANQFGQIKHRLKPLMRRNIEQKISINEQPVQIVLQEFGSELQHIFSIDAPDFMEFFNALTIQKTETVKNTLRKDQVINYFVFLMCNQDQDSHEKNCSMLFEQIEQIDVQQEFFVGISETAMSHWMLTNKNLVQNLMNLI